jgi:branched-chain amino acid aminotransferase
MASSESTDGGAPPSFAVDSPSLIWHDGRVIPWRDATVHVMSETACSGANVFEGVRIYGVGGALHVLALGQHLGRLRRSAELLNLPYDMDAPAWLSAIQALVRALGIAENCYLRPTVYAVAGKTYRTTEVGHSLALYLLPPKPLGVAKRAVVSRYRRLDELTLPPRIKCGGGFLPFRLAEEEASRLLGDDYEVLMMNRRGTLSEAIGASVFLVVNGQLHTPGLDSDLLDSITRQIVITRLAPQLGLEVVERDVEQAELLEADEVFLAGTMCELLPLGQIGGTTIGDGNCGDLTSRLLAAYEALWSDPGDELVTVL